MVIYQPKGAAREYAPLAVNLYKGCSHGCLYCYGPKVLHKDRLDFMEGYNQARDDIILKIEKDAQKLQAKGINGPVFLCFTCDPYDRSRYDGDLTTSEAIEVLNHYDLGVRILTKGGLLAQSDFSLLHRSAKNEFGVTLTHDRDSVSWLWEPRAALPDERILTLKRARGIGLKTWVSLEPVIDPEAALRLIDSTKDFVDFYRIGKLNYHSLAKEIDWAGFRSRVIDKLESHGKQYLIKKSLKDI